MRYAILVLALMWSPAMAQEKVLSSNELWVTANSNNVLRNPPPMASISRDGEVTINWQRVEETAADPSADAGGNKAWAWLMLAIRDGKWKPPVNPQ